MIGDFLALALVLGCGGTPMERDLTVSRSRGYSVTVDTLGVPSILLAPAPRVFSYLPTVLTELGLNINFQEPAARRVGTCFQKVRTRLGGTLLSNFVDCGENRGLPNADRYEVALTVLATVESTGPATSKVYVYVLGVGLENTGASGNRVWCFSKGGLERQITRGLEQRVGT